MNWTQKRFSLRRQSGRAPKRKWITLRTASFNDPAPDQYENVLAEAAGLIKLLSLSKICVTDDQETLKFCADFGCGLTENRTNHPTDFIKYIRHL